MAFLPVVVSHILLPSCWPRVCRERWSFPVGYGLKRWTRERLHPRVGARKQGVKPMPRRSLLAALIECHDHVHADRSDGRGCLRPVHIVSKTGSSRQEGRSRWGAGEVSHGGTLHCLTPTAIFSSVVAYFLVISLMR